MHFSLFDILIIIDKLNILADGLKITLALAIIGGIFSLILGIFIGSFKASKNKFFRYPSTIYVEFFTNTPLLIQVYLFYYLTIQGLNINPFIAGLLGLCTYTSAFMAEIIQAGIQTIPKYQIKAADALGFNAMDKISKIILPQVFRSVTPAISIQLKNLTKNSSIVYFIGVADITFMFEYLSSNTFKYAEFFVITALIYMIICWIIAIISYLLERYLYIPGIKKLKWS